MGEGALGWECEQWSDGEREEEIRTQLKGRLGTRKDRLKKKRKKKKKKKGVARAQCTYVCSHFASSEFNQVMRRAVIVK